MMSFVYALMFMFFVYSLSGFSVAYHMKAYKSFRSLLLVQSVFNFYCISLFVEVCGTVYGPRFTKNLTTNRGCNSMLKYRRYDYELS